MAFIDKNKALYNAKMYRRRGLSRKTKFISSQEGREEGLMDVLHSLKNLK